MVRSAADFAAITAEGDYDVLAVDEAQFFPLDTPMTDSLGWFGRAIRDLLRERARSDLRIIIAGLVASMSPTRTCRTSCATPSLSTAR